MRFAVDADLTGARGDAGRGSGGGDPGQGDEHPETDKGAHDDEPEGAPAPAFVVLAAGRGEANERSWLARPGAQICPNTAPTRQPEEGAGEEDREERGEVLHAM